MSEWSLRKPPVFFPSAVADPKGWVNPLTGEVLATIRSLPTKRRDNIDSSEDNLTLGDGFDLLEETLVAPNEPKFLKL